MESFPPQYGAKLKKNCLSYIFHVRYTTSNLLTGFSTTFKLEDFERRVIQLSQIDPGVSDGFKTRGDIVAALKSLYRVGALGNRFLTEEKGQQVSRDRWVFREYEDPTLDEDFIVHESLRKVFQLGYGGN